MASDGRGQDEGTLIGANVIYIYDPSNLHARSLHPYPHHIQIRVSPFQKPPGIYVSTAIDHIAIPRLPSSSSNPDTFPYPLAGICPRRFLSDVKV